MNAAALRDEAGRAPPGSALAAALARTRRTFARHVAFLVAVCLAVGVLLWAFSGSGFLSRLVYSFSVGSACFAVMGGMRYLQAALVDLVRRLRRLPPSPAGFQSGWRGIAPALLVAVLLGPSFGLSVADRLTGGHSPSLLSLGSTDTRATLVITLLASIVSVVVLSSLERLSAARAQAEAAQRQAAEAQLKLLQSQLEPHMLFNTLANLRVLIALDAPRAQAMLDRLIAYLRATLAASRAATHPLAAEFERIDDYLALMAVRMGPRLQVTLTLPPALAALPVPPLLLQPLVENGIQHGLEPQVEGGRIEVTAARAGDALVLTVRDGGVGLHAAPGRSGGGFGLTQVRERLATAYGDRARLDVAPAEGGGTIARITLPLPQPSTTTP